MIIHLDPDVFEVVKNGSKNIEVRVNDEKRRRLKVGDGFTFLKRPEETESLKAIVTSLDYYDNFEELVKHYEIKNLYLDSYTKEEFLKLLERFYSIEEQKEFGVVAIGFKLV